MCKNSKKNDHIIKELHFYWGFSFVYDTYSQRSNINIFVTYARYLLRYIYIQSKLLKMWRCASLIIEKCIFRQLENRGK